MGVEELGTDAEGNAKATAKPGKRDSVFHRLYVGTGAFDVVGKRKRWYFFFGAWASAPASAPAPDAPAIEPPCPASAADEPPCPASPARPA